MQLVVLILEAAVTAVASPIPVDPSSTNPLSTPPCRARVRAKG